MEKIQIRQAIMCKEPVLGGAQLVVVVIGDVVVIIVGAVFIGI